MKNSIKYRDNADFTLSFSRKDCECLEDHLPEPL